jgi:small GTP-binding protein
MLIMASRLAAPVITTVRRGRSSSSLISPAVEALRSRQRAATTTLERLLTKQDADERDVGVLRESVTTLDAIFLVCIVGEFNAGKSSLINALIGGEYCKVGVLPTTDTVTLLGQAAAQSAPRPATDGVLVKGVEAAPWLRDVSIVDTPGTNTLDARHTALTSDFVPRADVVVFVTSAERPFSESEALFLRSIREWGKKIVFVVNKVRAAARVCGRPDAMAHAAARVCGRPDAMAHAAAWMTVAGVLAGVCRRTACRRRCWLARWPLPAASMATARCLTC